MDFTYICSECKREYKISPTQYLCDDCKKLQKDDEPLRGVLNVKLYSDTPVKKDFDIFDLLPVEKEFFPDSPVGNTPLWSPSKLRKKTGFSNLYIKDDGANPTGSLKDRASYLISAFAKKNGISEIVLASTGNAASSMAGVGASADQNITIFLPSAAPKAKMIQSLQFGAKVLRVDGNYDKAFDLSMEYGQGPHLINRNTAYNPLTIEGKKTVSLEIFKQLKKAPDFVFVSSGDGVILSGVYKGFKDLRELKIIDKLPTIVSVQAIGSSAIYRALQVGHLKIFQQVQLPTLFCVDVPRNGYHALNNLKRYDGICTTVTDDEILEAQYSMAKDVGLFGEPAGATAMAGFLKLQDRIDSEQTVVIINTGNGLKDPDSAQHKIEIPEKLINKVSDIE